MNKWSSGRSWHGLLRPYTTINHSRNRSTSGTMKFLDEDVVKPTSRLPPKRLPGRRSNLLFISVTVIATTIVIGLAVLISKIQDMLPETDAWYGFYVDGVSCDLINKGNVSRWQSAFQINLRGSAHMSFAEAKFTDLAFDLLVGQGGRLVMGLVAYSAFMDALLRSMELSAVPYKVYVSLAFSASSLQSVWYAFRAIASTKGWKSKLFLLWCGLSILYVLSFPVLIESATGYLNPSEPSVRLPDNTFLTLESEQLVSCYNVSGGALIGLSNDTVVPGPSVSKYDVNVRELGFSPGDDIPGVEKSSLFYTLVSYHREQYKVIYDATNTSYPPSLNGTANYQDYSAPSFTTNITINNKTHVLHNAYVSQLYNTAYCFGADNDSRMISTDQLDQPSCMTEDDFIWGFSSVLLYVILSLQLAWTFSLYIVWLNANISSHLLRNGRTVGGHFRAAADLAEAMRESLGDDFCAYTDKQLNLALQKSNNEIQYYSTAPQDQDVSHIGLTSTGVDYIKLNKNVLYGASNAN